MPPIGMPFSSIDAHSHEIRGCPENRIPSGRHGGLPYFDNGAEQRSDKASRVSGTLPRRPAKFTTLLAWS